MTDHLSLSRRGMSATTLYRKLGRYPADAQVSGMLSVENAPVWLFRLSSKHRVEDARGYLKRHRGRRMAILDMYITEA